MSRPWMPLYVADYLADTAHLRAAQSGAYLHLIMHYWQKGGLPTADAQLAAIARMSDKEWKATRPLIEPFFQEGWKHKRIDQELAKASDVSERRKESAGKRWSKRDAIASPIADANDMHRAGVSQPQSQPQNEDIPPPPYDPAAADLDSIDQRELERRCVQATGWNSTTGISAIVDFVKAGADLEEVVLPMLRILAKEHRETNRKPPNVWAYAVKVLRDPTRRPARAGPLPALDFIEEGTTLFEQLMAGPKASFWRKVTVKHPETGRPGIYRKKEAA